MVAIVSPPTPASGTRASRAVGRKTLHKRLVLFSSRFLEPLCCQEWRMSQIGLCQFPPGRAHELSVILLRRCERDAHYGVVGVGADDRVGFPAQTVRTSSILDRADTMAQQLTEHCHSTVRHPQVLQTVDGDRPLTDLSL